MTLPGHEQEVTHLPGCVTDIVNNWTVIRLASFLTCWTCAWSVEWHHTL